MTTPMLKNGSHARPEDGVCAMEAVAWIAGERHSDSPECCSPTIATFLRRWNDALLDAERDILVPLLPLVVGTRGTEADELVRSHLAFDWLVRTHVPVWMALSESLEHHATQLRGLPELRDEASIMAANPVIAAAAAAGDAARDAARDAAGDAAEAAGQVDLEPAKRELQQSACDLVLRMVAVAPGKPPLLAVEECPYVVIGQ